MWFWKWLKIIVFHLEFSLLSYKNCWPNCFPDYIEVTGVEYVFLEAETEYIDYIALIKRMKVDDNQ